MFSYDTGVPSAGSASVILPLNRAAVQYGTTTGEIDSRTVSIYAIVWFTLGWKDRSLHRFLASWIDFAFLDITIAHELLETDTPHNIGGHAQ
jgi:hypothetical protein